MTDLTNSTQIPESFIKRCARQYSLRLSPQLYEAFCVVIESIFLRFGGIARAHCALRKKQRFNIFDLQIANRIAGICKFNNQWYNKIGWNDSKLGTKVGAGIPKTIAKNLLVNETNYQAGVQSVHAVQFMIYETVCQIFEYLKNQQISSIKPEQALNAVAVCISFLSFNETKKHFFQPQPKVLRQTNEFFSKHSEKQFLRSNYVDSKHSFADVSHVLTNTSDFSQIPDTLLDFFDDKAEKFAQKQKNIKKTSAKTKISIISQPLIDATEEEQTIESAEPVDTLVAQMEKFNLQTPDNNVPKPHVVDEKSPLDEPQLPIEQKAPSVTSSGVYMPQIQRVNKQIARPKQIKKFYYDPTKPYEKEPSQVQEYASSTETSASSSLKSGEEYATPTPTPEFVDITDADSMGGKIDYEGAPSWDYLRKATPEIEAWNKQFREGWKSEDLSTVSRTPSPTSSEQRKNIAAYEAKKRQEQQEQAEWRKQLENRREYKDDMSQYNESREPSIPSANDDSEYVPS